MPHTSASLFRETPTVLFLTQNHSCLWVHLLRGGGTLSPWTLSHCCEGRPYLCIQPSVVLPHRGRGSERLQVLLQWHSPLGVGPGSEPGLQSGSGCIAPCVAGLIQVGRESVTVVHLLETRPEARRGRARILVAVEASCPGGLVLLVSCEGYEAESRIRQLLLWLSG